MRLLALALLTLLLPAGASAATGAHEGPARLATGRTLVIATSSPGNAYAAGASVVVASSVAGDLSIIGGSVTEAGPVAGDALLVGGAVHARGNVAGDLRILAGTTDIGKPVGGDLAVLALGVQDSAPVSGSVFVAALSTELTGGAGGPVSVYGNAVTLGGDFTGDVRVFAADRLTLLPGTHIHGSLIYQAPLASVIPDSVSIDGSVSYRDASYLPGAGISHTLAFASIGIFFVAELFAALVLAGLLTGLFPGLAEHVVAETRAGRTRRLLLTALLGFAAFVATPILILLLSLTFIGLALAALLLILYALLLLLSFIYAGIVIGGLFGRRVLGRQVRWPDGVLGMFVLFVFGAIPIVGLPMVLLLASFTAGSLLAISFRFAFGQGEDDDLV